MTDFYDPLEQRDPATREAALLAAWPGHIARAQQATSAFADTLAGVDAAAIGSHAALARLPVLRQHALLQGQQALRAHDPRTIRLAASRPSAGAACGPAGAPSACSSRPARSTNPKAMAATTGAWHARFSPPACGRATWRTAASAR
jgi:hypothetical protein